MNEEESDGLGGRGSMKAAIIAFAVVEAVVIAAVVIYKLSRG